jgi:hypothetical protein
LFDRGTGEAELFSPGVEVDDVGDCCTSGLGTDWFAAEEIAETARGRTSWRSDD